MAQIRIESKPVYHGYMHAYLVYVDDLGNETVIRGGPTFDNPVWGFGPIAVEVGTQMLLGTTEDYRPINERDLHGSTVLDLGGRDATAVWQEMLQVAQTIGNANVDYDIQGTAQNSNSVIASVLARVGIDYSLYPTAVTLANNLGIGNSLEQTFYDIAGSANVDELHGGALGDTLIGGAGADKLYGAGGDDILIGGTSDIIGPFKNGTKDDVKDLLDGGIGYDSYYLYDSLSFFSAASAPILDMIDHIVDSDGLGQIYLPVNVGITVTVHSIYYSDSPFNLLQ